MNKLSLSCPHFNVCSGCVLSEDLSNPPKIQEARIFFAQLGVGLEVHAGSPYEWRYRAKLAVRGSVQEPCLGLFEKGSHEIVDIPLCRVHHPHINAAANTLKSFIKTHKLTPYNENNCQGLIRYAQFAVEQATGKVQVALVVNANTIPPSLRESLFFLWDDQLFHSLWVNANTRKDNVIFGSDWFLVKGEEFLWQNFAGREVCFHPASFAQANPIMFAKLLNILKEHVPTHASVIDYYSGVGLIGLFILDKCASVICSEVVPQAEICFEASKAKLPSAHAAKIKFVLGPSSKQVDLLDSVEIAIVDPPRKGIENELLQNLIKKQRLKKIIYVSCGWESFKKDTEKLLANGWRLTVSHAFLLFPGSDHIEILAIFESN